MLQQSHPQVGIADEQQISTESAAPQEIFATEHRGHRRSDGVGAAAHDAPDHPLAATSADDSTESAGRPKQCAVVVDEVGLHADQRDLGVGLEDGGLRGDAVGVDDVVGADEFDELAVAEADGQVEVVHHRQRRVVSDHPYAAVVEAFQDVGGAVGAVVVDDDDLDVTVVLRQQAGEGGV